MFPKSIINFFENLKKYNDYYVQAISCTKGMVFTFVNPYSYLIIRRNKNKVDFLDANYGRSAIFIDGFLLCMLVNFFTKLRVFRVSFDDSSLAPLVFRTSMEKKLKLGLIGSQIGIVDKASRYLKERYPDINIVYTQHGFYSIEEEHEILQRIFDCDVVVCSMGTPLQEEFLTKLKNMGWDGTGYTCGGYFDQLVYAHGGNFYPRWVDKLNLRWVFRLYVEPKKLISRLFLYYPCSLFYFLIDLIYSHYFMDKLKK